MILAAPVLILSAVFFFCFQITCQRILGRQHEQEYFQPTAKMIHLEFPSLQKLLEEGGGPADYSRLPKTLKDGFLGLLSAS
jgi:hypothetical protein